MPELALDDDQRYAFVRHLDSVRMSHLMWRKAAAHAGVDGDSLELFAGGGGLPQRLSAVGPWITHSSVPGGRPARISIHGSSRDQAQRSNPTSRRLPPLPRRIVILPFGRSRSVSARSSASLIRTDAPAALLSAQRRDGGAERDMPAPTQEQVVGIRPLAHARRWQPKFSSLGDSKVKNRLT
jgi:hypothetical protein